MLRIAIYLLFPFLFGGWIGAQAQQTTPVCTVNGRYEQVALDNLGNLFATRGSEVVRFNDKCTQLYRYSDLSLGRIDYLDVSNPLKILLFYRDFSKIVFLDNTLSPTLSGSLDLRVLGLSMATVACTSFDNGFWVFDAVNYRLVRFDQHMSVTAEVPGLDLIIGSRLAPTAMHESGDRLLIYDPQVGLLIFDVFGSYLRQLPEKDAEQFTAYADLMMFRKGDTVTTYDLERLTEGSFNLSNSEAQWFDARKGQMAICTPVGINLLKLSN